MRVIGFEGFRVSGFEGFRVLGFEGFRVSGFEGFTGLRVQGWHALVLSQGVSICALLKICTMGGSDPYNP